MNKVLHVSAGKYHHSSNSSFAGFPLIIPFLVWIIPLYFEMKHTTYFQEAFLLFFRLCFYGESYQISWVFRGLHSQFLFLFFFSTLTKKNHRVQQLVPYSQSGHLNQLSNYLFWLGKHKASSLESSNVKCKQTRKQKNTNRYKHFFGLLLLNSVYNGWSSMTLICLSKIMIVEHFKMGRKRLSVCPRWYTY